MVSSVRTILDSVPTSRGLSYTWCHTV
ncbi:hypothetical protein LINPERPRIM_LOCUS13212 [Linum perenne]